MNDSGQLQPSQCGPVLVFRTGRPVGWILRDRDNLRRSHYHAGTRLMERYEPLIWALKGARGTDG